jgi:TonB family protein
MVRKFLRASAAAFIAGLFTGLPGTALAVAPGFELAAVALHQETGRDIYLGGIYLDDATRDPGDMLATTGPQFMEYRVIARRTSMRSLLGGMLLQSEVATGAPPDSDTTAFANQILASVRGSLYAGDSFEIALDEKGTTSAHLNGHELARVANAGVARYLLMGWIGERGPSTSFRDSLLADAIDPALSAALERHRYSQARGNEVAAWLAPPAMETDQGVASTEPELKYIVTTGTRIVATTETMPSGALEPEPPQPIPVLGDAVIPEPDPAQKPLQLASLAPVPAFDIKEYSRRVGDFHRQLVAMVYGEIDYPRRAVRRELQGRLELDITLDNSGQLLEVTVVQSSGHNILDQAAVSAAQQALADEGLAAIDPMAAAEFRSETADNQLVVPVPIMFMLTQ